MKLFKNQLIILCLLFVSHIAYAENNTRMNDLPSSEVMDADYNFSNVPDGDIVLHSFKIRNTGSGMLDVLKVRPE